MNRRDFLKAITAGGASLALQSLWMPWLPRLAFAQNGVQGDVIVCIFLRGGADGLNIIVPHGDENYYAARPTLAISQPDRAAADRGLMLDDFFSLNPDMAALHELLTTGRLKAVHAVGAPHVSRSHFEAMDLLERGTDGESGVNSGWLGRYLNATSSTADTPLRAIGWGDRLPTSLRGYVGANAFNSITEYHLHGDQRETDAMLARLARMYENADEPLEQGAAATLQTLGIVQQVDVDNYRPAHGAEYAETDFGRALRQTAALIKADTGLEVACIDLGNFDTHITQGVTVHQGAGIFPGLVTELADNLRAFHDDMQDYLGRVSVVVMSEFGRRVQENGAGGTDHGHGGIMLLMGDHLAPGAVHAEWPGLNSDFLEDGDLEITTDYRDVLGEILLARTPLADLRAVFPDHTYQRAGVLR
ncbi:MAG: DUF1501 domain-containing protein [Anaerolineales bacterium]